ncbi:MAG: metalloregulator ArsR/SmtB family transcription factor [Kofleriaceae bacterium]
MKRAESDLRPVDGREANDELAALAKAIAHPARMRIVRYLEARTNCTCGELVGELALAQSTVSQHLAVMKAAGLVGTGPSGDYHLQPAGLRRLRAL